MSRHPAIAQKEIASTASMLQIVSYDQDGITLEFNITNNPLQFKEDSKEQCLTPLMIGLEETHIPGAPILPATSVLLGVPESHNYSVEISEFEEETIHGYPKLCWSKQVLLPDVGEQLLSTVEMTTNVQAPNPILHNPVDIVQSGFMRSQPIVQLAIYPVQYDQQTGSLRIIRMMRFKLKYQQPQTRIQVSGFQPVEENLEFEGTLRSSLINYEEARKWRTVPKENLNSLNFLAEYSPLPPAYLLVLPKTGVYELTYTELKSAGIPVDTIDPRNIHIYKEGSEISVDAAGQQDGRFDPNDTLLFYADVTPNKFSNEAYYWLSWNDVPGKRIQTVAISENPDTPAPAFYIETNHHEKNLVYSNSSPSGPDNDHWYWSKINSVGPPASGSFPISVEHIFYNDMQATLQGLIKGFFASPQHHTRILINGHLILDQRWEAKDELQFSVTFPVSYLTAANTILIELPMDGGITREMINVNWFNITYPRGFVATNQQLAFTGQVGPQKYQLTGFDQPDLELFDISDPSNPLLLNGSQITETALNQYSLVFDHSVDTPHRYFAQSKTQRLRPLEIRLTSEVNLKSPANAADYILITPGSLISAAEQLTQYRQAQGFRTKVVPVETIYEQFSYGSPNPNAIKDFISYAYHHWSPPAPLYILLFGDGNFDYKNNFGFNDRQYIPPYLFDLDPWISETAADNRYVMVSGSDTLPDLYIGRLPVKTISEATAMVEKIKTYENTPLQEWNFQTLFIADDTDEAGDFGASQDHLSGLLPDLYQINKAYFGTPEYTAVNTLRAKIIAELNSGRGMTMYAGHGSILNWASPNFFHRRDIAQLAPTTRFTFAMTLDCMDGYFLYPSTTTTDNSSLMESLVRAPDRGAIAAFSPTGWGLVEGHDILATGLFEAIFTHGINRAGAATTYAKYYLAANSAGHRELIDTYTLFGDPALQLKLGPAVQPAPADLSVQLSLIGGEGLPAEWVDVQLDYANLGSVPAEGITLSLPIPAQLLDPTVTTAPVLAQHAGAPYTFIRTSLNPGQSGRVTLRARVDPAVVGYFGLPASIASASIDANPANNSATLVLGSAPPTDLSVQISTLAAGPFLPGEWVDVQLAYANHSADADGVSLSLPVSDPFMQPEFTLPAGWVEQPGQAVTWSIPALPAGAQGTILGRVQLAPNASGSPSLATAITSYTPDTNPANNNASLNIQLHHRYWMPLVMTAHNHIWLPLMDAIP